MGGGDGKNSNSESSRRVVLAEEKGRLFWDVANDGPLRQEKNKRRKKREDPSNSPDEKGGQKKMQPTK